MAHIKAADLEVRRATPDDDGEVIPLLQAALKKDEDPHYRAFLEWKHRQNPFGVSPAWVALHEGRIVGYRTLLRWRFINDEGKKVTAVRAVDTATHPDFQGLGIFRLLTVRGVAELTMEGDGIVFNTPNDQSRPGYLKMGWSEVKRLPIGCCPLGRRRWSGWCPPAFPPLCGPRTPPWALPAASWLTPTWPTPCSLTLRSVDSAPTGRRSTWPGARPSGL
ncbi:GNAT family N-acetyltransferase [Tessaracoccus flavus]|uniref:GNAT family N-acetyltransferase n=1 Tax=Tessaracoccus flavus TaxID=1610493 RepID=UPI001D03E764|nr:GNAT family N-acetyltransferase [Tessaracoccus flavus]